MYDIKIFLEDNGQFWGKLNTGKEFIYWLWNNQEELMNELKEWLDFSYENKEKNENVSRLVSYFNSTNKELICH